MLKSINSDYMIQGSTSDRRNRLCLDQWKGTGTDEEILQCAFSVKKHHCTSADGTERSLFISLNRQFLLIEWLEWFWILLLLSSVRDRKTGAGWAYYFPQDKSISIEAPYEHRDFNFLSCSEHMHRLSLGCSFQTTRLYLELGHLMVSEYHTHSLSSF